MQAQVLALSALDILLQSLREEKRRRFSHDIQSFAGEGGGPPDSATPCPGLPEGPAEATSTEGLPSSLTASANQDLRESPDIRGTRGVYLWGSVGSGKTMLMDLLVAAARKQGIEATEAPASHAEEESRLEAERFPASGSGPSIRAETGSVSKEIRLLRLHFHEFMLATHSQLHKLHKSLPRVVSSSRDGLPIYR